MKLTTYGRFAVTAMIDVALHQKNGPVNLASISARARISQSYLEQIFSRIRRHHLVSSTRGPGGGYTLQRPAENISIAAIISAVNNDLDATQCGGLKNCQEGNQPCFTHDLWMKATYILNDYLESVSLEDLCEQYYRIQNGEVPIEKFFVPITSPHKTPTATPQKAPFQKMST